MEKFVMELQEKLGEEGLKLQEPMKEHTTFRVGGPADLFLMPKNAEGLKESIEILKKHDVPMMVIGNGSNLLVRDKGIRGAVIQVYNRMAEITVDGEMGVNLFKMTPYYFKTELGAEEKIRKNNGFTTEIHFDFLVYKKI